MSNVVLLITFSLREVKQAQKRLKILKGVIRSRKLGHRQKHWCGEKFEYTKGVIGSRKVGDRKTTGVKKILNIPKR